MRVVLCNRALGDTLFACLAFDGGHAPYGLAFLTCFCSAQDFAWLTGAQSWTPDRNGLSPPLDRHPVAMLQGDYVGALLLYAVRVEDLQRERQQLDRVSPPLLHGPVMPEPLLCVRVRKQG